MLIDGTIKNYHQIFQSKTTNNPYLLFSFLVVSIDLFLVFFMPFSYNGVYLRQTKFLPFPSPSPTFRAPKLFFYVLKRNVPLYLILTFPNHILLLYLPKNDIVRKERREQVIFVAPSQRNATFILHCMVFD